jgi:hypothetical protein
VEFGPVNFEIVTLATNTMAKCLPNIVANEIEELIFNTDLK